VRETDGSSVWDEVVETLYGLPPAEFTPARAAAVRRERAAGRRELAEAVGRLRKPSTAAWVVNMLVRHRREEVDQLLDLGGQLRAAQAALAGDELRELGRQRHQVISATGRQARALARELGHPVSEAIAEEVEQTFSAALADPRAAEAVRGGSLTAGLTYAGMGEVDLGTVPARPHLTSAPAPPAAPSKAAPATADRRAREAARRAREQREAAVKEAEADVQEAGEAVARAEEDLRGSAARRAEAARRQVAVQRRVEELRARLHAAETEAVSATHDVRRLEHEHQAVERAAALARRMADRARTRLERAAADAAFDEPDGDPGGAPP